MNSPEFSGPYEKQTPPIIETSWRNVTVRALDQSNLPELKNLIDKNVDYFARGHIVAGLYDVVANEISDKDTPTANQRFGIWHRNTLIGYIGLTTDHDTADGEYDVAYAIDKDNAGLGITTAAVRALVNYEKELGHTFTAEVESDNIASQRVLKKLGFAATNHYNDRDRPVYVQSGPTLVKR